MCFPPTANLSQPGRQSILHRFLPRCNLSSAPKVPGGAGSSFKSNWCASNNNSSSCPRCRMLPPWGIFLMKNTCLASKYFQPKKNMFLRLMGWGCEKSYNVESDHAIGEGTSRMNTLLLNSALSSLLPWRITSSVRLLKENVTLSWAAWRIKNTSSGSWPSDRIHVIRWEADLHSFTKMTGNFQPRTKWTKSRDGKTCHTSKDLFLESSWKKVSRLKTHFGHFLLLFSNNEAWAPWKNMRRPAI